MSARKRRALGAISAIAALAVVGGVAAQFSTSTTSAPQSIGTGTVGISLDNVAPTVWTDDISNLAAGDAVQRFVDVRNSGTLKLASINLAQTNTLGDLLTSPSDVHVKFEACSVAWNTTTGACSSGVVKVLDSTSVRGWAGALPLSTFEDFGAGEIRHLRLTTSLDATATNAVQNKKGTITYTFGGTQRAAGTYGTVSDSTTILGSPATLTTTPSAATASAATFSFTDPSSGKASYSVSWGETGNSAVAPQVAALPSGATSYTLTGLEAGKSYDVALTAQMGVQKTTSTTTYNTAPATPAALTTSAITATGASVSWTDKTAGKASYELTYTTGTTSKVVTVAAGTSTASLSGLSAGSGYVLSLVAKVDGIPSAPLTTTMWTLPAAATAVTASAITATGATVSWTDNSGSKASYVLQYTTGSTTKSVSVAAGSNSATLSGLSASSTYSLSLVGTANGVSAAPVTGSFTTTAPAPTAVTLSASPAMSGYSLPAGTTSANTGTTAVYDNQGQALGVDGNLGTTWVAAGYSGQADYLFPGYASISSVRLAMKGSPATNQTYTIHGRNLAGDWVQIGSATKALPAGVITQYSIPVTTGNYTGIRININAGSSWVNLYEMTLNG